MAIVDTFPYFNEKELIELRIKLLYDYVDKFIIIDANKTHKGDNKPFTCKNTLESLGLLSDKVFVVELDFSNQEHKMDPWVREREQRNAALPYISDNDVCIVSDCDEIIDPNYINYYIDVSKKNPNNILRIPLYFLCGRADLRVHDVNNNPVSWRAPFICTKSHADSYSFSEIRESYSLYKNNLKYNDIFITEDENIKEVGWHFSWMGPIERLKIKGSSFLHYKDVVVQDGYSPKDGSHDPLGRREIVLREFPDNLLPDLLFELDGVKNFLLPRM